MIRAAALFGLAGLALATGLVVYQGLGAVLAALAGAGLGLIWASAFHAVPMLLNARAWQVLLPRSAARPGLGFFLWAVWIREAVNGLLPVARIGGEVVSARLLIRRGLRPPRAVASLVVDMTLALVSQFLFTLIGVLLLLRHDAGTAIALDVALGLGLTLVLLAGLAVVQRFGLFGLLARSFRLVFGSRFDRLVGGAATLDRSVRLLYRRYPPILACVAWQLVAWIAGAGEIWVAARFLGHPLDLADALLVEALIQAVSSTAFVVPGALGVQEGSFLLLGGAVGLSPELALALALARRARDLIVFVPGLLLWQFAEGRRLLAPV